eukprot:PhM_4_TR15893/c1_g1_i1/m.72021
MLSSTDARDVVQRLRFVPVPTQHVDVALAQLRRARCGGVPVFPTAQAQASSDMSGLLVIVVPIVAVLAAGIVTYAIYIAAQRQLRHHRVQHAPTDPDAEFCSLIVCLKKETQLRERYPATLPKALHRFSRIVRDCVWRHACYEVRPIGASAVLIVSRRASDLASCAGDLLAELDGVVWDDVLLSAPKRKMSSVRPIAGLLPRQSTSMISDTTTVNSNGSGSDRASSSRHASLRFRTLSSISSTNGPLQLNFSMGMSCGLGIITNNSDNDNEPNTNEIATNDGYDYAGACVDTAAVLADCAYGGQILASRDFVRSHTNNDDIFEPFKDSYQYNPPGLPTRSFNVRSSNDEDGSDDEHIDSVAATLQHQRSGCSLRRVTILSLHVDPKHFFNKDAPRQPIDKIQQILDTINAGVVSMVEGARGTLLSNVAGRIVIGFNVKNPVSRTSLRATTLFSDLKDLFTSQLGGKLLITAGVYTADTLVGSVSNTSNNKNKTKRQQQQGSVVLLGNVCEVASSLQQECISAGHHSNGGCELLCLDATAKDLQVHMYTECIDIVPGRGRIYCVRGEKGASDDDNDDENKNDNEWIYELEQQEGRDPYSAINGLYSELLGDVDGTNDFEHVRDALKLLMMTIEEEQIDDKEEKNENKRSAELMYGAQQLQRIVSQFSSLESYYDNKAKLKAM